MILFKQTVDASLLVIDPAQSRGFPLELSSRQESLNPPQFVCCLTFLSPNHFSELHYCASVAIIILLS